MLKKGARPLARRAAAPERLDAHGWRMRLAPLLLPFHSGFRGSIATAKKKDARFPERTTKLSFAQLEQKPPVRLQTVGECGSIRKNTRDNGSLRVVLAAASDA